MTFSSWVSVSLGELVDIKHGFAFSGEYFRDTPSGDILLTPGNFAIGGGFKADKFKYYDGPVPEDYILHEGDLLITMTDLSKQADTLGFPALIPAFTHFRFLHNQRLGRVEIRPNANVEKKFLYYVLQTKSYRQEVIAGATGTTVKHTSPNRIKAFKFKLPPKSEQYAIASILGALDDRIELNRRMNETLEAMARAIFQSWFVDFDPVCAKLEGQQPWGMDADTAALFSAEFDCGGLPVGWEQTAFSETIEIIGGGTPKTTISDYWGGDISWFSIVDVPNLSDVFVIDTEKKITQAGLEGSSTKLLGVGTTIITARGTVGKVALVGVPMAMNQSCYGIRGTDGLPPYYTYFSVRHLVADLQARTHGTVFDTITRDTFKSVGFAKPPAPVAQAFDAMVEPFLNRILSNLKETRTLVDLRDTLLPKLISGEIRVKEAEQKIEEAIV